MRWVICALAVFAFAPRALADDLDLLRGSQPVGPPTYYRWSGLYFGGQFGDNLGRADFSNATQEPIAFALRETALENDFSPSLWQVLGTATHARESFGGFIGYNSQWQDLVLGLEANYNQAAIGIEAPSFPISRITPGNGYLVNIDSTGSLTNLDFGSVRARAGYVLGNVLPYGFFGLALGQADMHVSTTVSGEQNPPTSGACLSTNVPPCTPFSFTATTGRDSQVLVGFSVGLGIDYAITPNIFLRGEYEYTQFAPEAGILVDVNSVRAGAALKF